MSSSPSKPSPAEALAAQPSSGNAPPRAAHTPLEEILQPLYDSLESGILLVGHDGLVTSCSLAMAMLFGRSPDELIGLTTADINALVLSIAHEPAQRLREEGLFPQSAGVRCEEFELLEPSRTVVRWVARKVQCPHYATVAVGTDITADVDLTSAYERMALTDRLTGIANRRGIERAVHHELLRLRRFQTPVSFALFDIDHFKMINDTHGHGTGDEVLRLVAKAMAGSVRDTDLVSRWGGEEFLVVLTETTYAGALVCAENIRARVATLGEIVGFGVTVSGGVYQPAPGESIPDILAHADGRLYEAKNNGRNRVC
jgi:diguanylate cyclase (GGDEF)-like protein